MAYNQPTILGSNAPTVQGPTFGGFTGALQPEPTPFAPQPQPDDIQAPPTATPGSYTVDLTNPAGTGQDFVEGTRSLLDGLKNILFGSSKVDAQGSHGGLGDIPGWGHIGRFLTEGAADALGAVPKVPGAVADVVGGVLEHIDVTNPIEKQALRMKFEMLQDSEIKAEALKKIAEDPGAAGHYMSQALRDTQTSLAVDNPELFAGLYEMPGSVADTITNIFGGFQALQRGTERLIAGAARPGADVASEGLLHLDFANGLNQLDIIRRVAEGRAVFVTGEAQLSPVEIIAVSKTKTKEWTDSQALDFLASHGAGLSHDVLTEIAGSLATDPLNAASLGAAAVAKVGQFGAKLNAARVASGDAAQLAKIAGTSARLNVVGKAGETQRVSELLAMAGRRYDGLQGTALGRAAKISRTIIDPLHALDTGKLGAARDVDLLSDATSKAVVAAHGFVNHLKLVEKLSSLGDGGTAMANFIEDLGVYSANVARRVVAAEHRAGIIAQGMAAGAENQVAALRKMLPKGIVDDLMKNQKRDILDGITAEANKYRRYVWDDTARENLVKRLSLMYDGKTADEWKAFIEGLEPDQLSMMHAATFGRAQTKLFQAINAAKLAGPTGTGRAQDLFGKLDKLTLINKQTLTRQGADGIFEAIDAAGTDMGEAIKIVRLAQEEYPALKAAVIDPTDLYRSVESFQSYLQRRYDSLPMQLVDDEKALLSPELAQLADEFTDSFTIGFRPDDEFLWNVETTNAAQGEYDIVGDVWVGDVGNAPYGYHPSRAAQFNIAGVPLPVKAAGKLVTKPIDYMEAMGRTLVQGVTGTMISEAARQKFVQKTGAEWQEAGLTEDVAREMWQGIRDLVDSQSAIVNPRGFEPKDLWRAVEGVIPMAAKAAGFEKRELMSAILDAYNGDLRFIGLTQKLTSRIKQLLFEGTESNIAGQIAEHAWPLMKFRLNLMFQVQERLEPIILNAQRGATVALGTKMTKSDALTKGLLDKYVERSLQSLSDIDNSEYSAAVLHGKNVRRAASKPGTQLTRIKDALSNVTDIQGAKQINLLRTFRKGLGAEIKPLWEETHPGVWDDMLADASRRAGGLLSDDDFAVQLLADKLMGNDILVSRVAKAAGLKGVDLKAEFRNAIRPGMWAMPSHVGELQSLDLDGMAKTLGFVPRGSTTGKVITDQAGLRSALADGSVKMDEVKEALRLSGADKDYIARVESALNFSWTGFWDTAATKFNLSKSEVQSLQEFFGAAARMRGMKPVDYISQIISPGIRGDEGAAGQLGKLVDILRDGRTVQEPSLGTLVAKEGATREDLVNQLSSIFSAHLDPSAKLALLKQFSPELKQAVTDGKLPGLDMATIDDLWAKQGESELAKFVLEGRTLSPEDIFDQAVRNLTPEQVANMFPDRRVKVYEEYYDKQPPLGDGILSDLRTTPQNRAEILAIVAREKVRFPGLQLAHVNTLSPAAIDVTFGAGESIGTSAFVISTSNGRSAMILNSDMFGPGSEAKMVARAEKNERSKIAPSFDIGEGLKPRVSYPNVPWHADVSPNHTVYHELGHVIDDALRNVEHEDDAGDLIRSLGMKGVGSARQKRYVDFYARYSRSSAVKAVSEYGASTVGSDNGAAEAMGELFAITLNPKFTAEKLAAMDALVPASVPAGPLRLPSEAVAELRTILSEIGIMKNVPIGPTLDPDLVRAQQMFAKFSQQAVRGGLLRGAAPNAEIESILNDLAKIPTEHAAPYNHTEAMLVNAAVQQMELKWQDAYRLQYYAQRRSMLERSINHPMFGIYPASYMWGKIAPEMIRFVAKEPFGLRTGAMARSMYEVQKQVAMQREFDPEFEAMVEKMGHSQFISFVGYMLPGIPWDINASWPTWMKDIAAQGLRNQENIEAGGTVEELNLVQPIVDTVKKTAPYLTTVPWAARAVGEARDFLDGDEPETTPGTSGPTPGASLAPTLSEEMRELKQLLGR